MLQEINPEKIVEGKIHGLKVKLGKVRKQALNAPNLEAKIEFKRKEKQLQEAIRQANLNYFEDISKLID